MVVNGEAKVQTTVPVSLRAVYDMAESPRNWMHSVVGVHALNDREAVWNMQAPFGNMTWRAERTIHTDDRIAWSFDGRGLTGFMEFRFKETSEGTAITARRFIGVRRGRERAAIADWLGAPQQTLEQDIQAFVRLLAVLPPAYVTVKPRTLRAVVPA